MLFCIPIGLIFVFFDGTPSDLIVSQNVLIISAFAGITTSVFIVSWLLAVKKSAYTALDAFVSLGLLVPIIFSSAFYSERITLSQILGLILLLIAVTLMSFYNNQIKDKLSASSIILLLIVGLSNGLTDFSYKIFKYSKDSTPASVFNLYIYLFSAITLLAVFLYFHFRHVKDCKDTDAKTESETADTPLLDRKKSVYIAIMAIFLFCNSYFKTLAASRLSAIQIYPLAQGGAMLLTLMMSAVFFKEKIKPLCIAGLIVLFISLLFINVIVF